MALSKRSRRRIVLVGLLLALLAGLAVGAVVLRDWRRAQAREIALRDGLAAFEAKDYATALAKLAPYVRSSDRDVQLLRSAAICIDALGSDDGSHLGQATALFTRVAELDPADLETRRRLLELYPKQGFLRESLDVAGEVLAVEPNDPIAREARVTALASMGRWEEAITAATEMVIAIPDSATARQLQLQVAFAAGDSPLTVIEYALDWPESGWNDGLDGLLVATLYALAGQDSLAEQAMSEAVAAGAANLERLEAMLSVLGDLRQLDQCKALMLMWGSDHPDEKPRLAVIAATWALQFGQREFLEEIFATMDGDRQAAAEVAVALALPLGAEYSEVSGVREAISDSDGVGAECRRRIFALQDVLLLSQRSDSEAYRRLRASAEEAPDDFVIQLSMLRGAIVISDYAAASQQLAAMSRWDSTPIVKQQSLEIARGSGRFDLMIEQTLDLLDQAPQESALLVGLARMWGMARDLPVTVQQRLQSTFGVSSASEFCDRLLASGVPPQLVLVPAIAAAVNDRRLDLLDPLVERLVADPSVGEEELVQVYLVLRDVAPELTGRIKARASNLSGSSFRIQGLMLPDSLPASERIARLKSIMPVGSEQVGERVEAWESVLQFLDSIDAPTFNAVAIEASDACEGSPRLLRQLLLDRRVWSDPAVSQQIIDALRGSIAGSAQELATWNAMWVLLNAPQDVERVRESIADLNDLLASDAANYGVGLTLLRLMLVSADGDRAAAVRVGLRLIRSRPKSVELYPVVIDLLQESGRFEEASGLISEYERLGGGIDPARQRANLEYRTGNFDDLAASLAKISQVSGDAMDRMRLGGALEATGDLIGAEKAYREALAAGLGDQALNGVIRLASTLTKLGRAEEITGVFDEYSSAYGAEQRSVILAGLLMESGNVDAAIAELRSASEQAPDLASVWRALAFALATSGDVAGAADATTRALLVEPSNQEMAMVALNFSLVDSTANRQFLEAIPETVEELSALSAALKVVAASRDAAGAISPDPADMDSVRALARARPDSLPVWFAAVSLHSAAGRYREAGELAKQAAVLFPLAEEPVGWRVSTAIAEGDIDGAIGLCREWRRLRFPDTAEIDFVQSRMELARGRGDLAYELLQSHQASIVARRKKDPIPFRVLLAAMLMSGRVSEALALVGGDFYSDQELRILWTRSTVMAPYRSAVEAMSLYESKVPPDAVAQAELVGEWLNLHERHPEGEGLARAESLLPRPLPEPVDPDSRLQLVAAAQVAMARRDTETAAALLKSVLDSTPAELVQAAKEFRTLPLAEQQSIFPGLLPVIYAKNNLAMVDLETMTNLEEALSMSDWCIALMPEVPELHDTRAQLLLALGRLSEADESSTMAISLRPDAVELMITGAEILAARDQTDDSRRLIQRVNLILGTQPWPSQAVLERLRVLNESR